MERYRNIYISFYSICESLSSLERSRTKISLPPLLLNSKNNKVKFCYRGGIDDKDDETDMSKKKRKEKKKGKREKMPSLCTKVSSAKLTAFRAQN